MMGKDLSPSKFGRVLAAVFEDLGYEHKRLPGGRSAYRNITFIGKED